MIVKVKRQTRTAQGAKIVVRKIKVCYTVVKLRRRKREEHTVNNIFDVARWFLDKEPMTHKKLQKLCYYAQAWSYLLLPGGKLKEEPFEAWVHGPVNRELWDCCKNYGYAEIAADNLPEGAQPITDAAVISFLEDVYATYGRFSGYQLENLTHREEPWQKARRGYDEFEPSREQIKPADMCAYYGSLISQQGVGE